MIVLHQFVKYKTCWNDTQLKIKIHYLDDLLHQSKTGSYQFVLHSSLLCRSGLSSIVENVSNVFSVLYYNSEIWHIPSLKNELKKKMTSISAKAIKTCMYYPDRMISYENTHKMNNRAMPEAFMSYKTAIQLHKVYNQTDPSLDWINLHFDQILTSRQTEFLISKTNKTKVGLNILSNRFAILNGLIPLRWLNLNIDTYKIHCKKLFLATWFILITVHYIE